MITPFISKKPAVSFFTREPAVCPVCGAQVPREEMLTGGGRMIAGPLSPSLRRMYEPSARFGKIYPSMYGAGACPQCFLALFWGDFKAAWPRDALDKLYAASGERADAARAAFPGFDFSRPRTPLDGAALYYLALMCYGAAPAPLSPTVKRAVCALRAAWLCGDLDGLLPGRNYGIMRDALYRKAAFFYEAAADAETEGTESALEGGFLGPDADKNYGFDGVIYLRAFLEWQYGQREDGALRRSKLEANKRAVARLFGFGRTSKSKPGPLLEHARALYEHIASELGEAGAAEGSGTDE